MGKAARQKQQRLGEKLKQIREGMGLSQNEIVLKLGIDSARGMISLYENNRREPPLYILLNYSRLSGVCLDEIVDDEVDLPKNLPAKRKGHHRIPKN
jgi:transcriptional regulator with XRE-family HTH domain